MSINQMRTGGALHGALARSLTEVDSAPFVAGDRLGPFEIETLVSQGGMGSVYRARRVLGNFEQRVAIKCPQRHIFNPELEDLFQRERQLLATLEHPGIARLIDGGIGERNTPWYAMEWVEGVSIQDWRIGKNKEWQDTVRAVIELCEALDHAHRHLLVHRDIKPSNVMVTSEGRVKLLDFGIAALVGDSETKGNLILTPRFASPEQFRGQSVGIASDVYQVGLLLGFLLSDEMQSQDQSDASNHWTLSRDSEHGDPWQPQALPRNRLQHLPRDLVEVIDLATRLEAHQRHRDCRALAEDLRAVLEYRPIASRARNTWYRGQKWMQRHPIVAGVGILGLGLLTLLAWQWRKEFVRAEQESEIAKLEAKRAMDEAQRAKLETERAKAVSEFFSMVMTWATPHSNRGESISTEEAMDRAVDYLKTLDTMHPVAKADLSYRLGVLYSNRQQYRKVVDLAEQGVKLIEPQWQTDPLLYLNLRIMLANHLNRPEEQERAFALMETTGRLMQGMTVPVEMKVRHARNYAGRLMMAGQFREADRIFTLMGSAIHSDDQATRETLRGLRNTHSTVLRLRGNYNAALELLQQSSADLEQEGLAQTEHMLNVLESQMMLLSELEVHDQALALLQRTEQLSKWNRDRNSESRFSTQSNKAFVLARAGRMDEAIAIGKDLQSLSSDDRLMAPGFAVRELRLNAFLDRKQGRFAAALEKYKLLRAKLKSPNQQQYDAGMALLLQATMHNELRQVEMSVPLLAEAEKWTGDLLPSHPRHFQIHFERLRAAHGLGQDITPHRIKAEQAAKAMADFPLHQRLRREFAEYLAKK